MPFVTSKLSKSLKWLLVIVSAEVQVSLCLRSWRTGLQVSCSTHTT